MPERFTWLMSQLLRDTCALESSRLLFLEITKVAKSLVYVTLLKRLRVESLKGLYSY